MDTNGAAHPLPPIVIANGFAPIPIEPSPLYRRLTDAGRTVSIVPFARDNMLDAAAYAERIMRHLAATRDRHGTGRLDLLGFSMGGVASLYAIKHFDAAPLVRTFVTFGAPFHGTPLWALARLSAVFAPAVRYLNPKSAFLEELRDGRLPAGPRYVSVGGTRDRICPAASTACPGTEHYTGPFTHHDFYVDARLHALLRSLLE